MFDDIMKEYDPNGTLTDAFFFDGASNVQKGGAILVAKHHHSFCFHGGEHILSRRLYNVFGSGAHHAIYAQFMAQSSMNNK